MNLDKGHTWQGVLVYVEDRLKEAILQRNFKVLSEIWPNLACQIESVLLIWETGDTIEVSLFKNKGN